MIGLTEPNAIMIQGATSSAGKSIVVAGLCRLFSNMGLQVAPFKPQNMALNSAVTIDGGEIGRSQAVQAQACRIQPHSDMNPILLKPNSDEGAQVIVQGRAVGNMTARRFHHYKKEAMAPVVESFQRLASRHDLIIIEGAGSPAEINLRENDIANMGFATAVRCPVFIVADIERGGLFAHLLGTVECLDLHERRLVEGYIINRFRGDPSLLDSGIRWLNEKTGISTLGVLPWLEGLHIEAEDSVGLGGNGKSSGKIGSERFRIVVPRIPRISNHTDFDPLKLQPDVELVFVDDNSSIPPADLVILPGSKSSISDLDWLKRNGWSDYLHRHLRYGGKLIGICGGYQMIGKVIHDPDGIEGPPGSREGLALMDFETILEPIKQLSNVTGKLNTSDSIVTGYEIHMGRTSGPDVCHPAVTLDDGRVDGAESRDGLVLCTYLHGVFDHFEARQSLLQWAGMVSAQPYDYLTHRDREINRVADTLDQHLDIERILVAAGVDHQKKK